MFYALALVVYLLFERFWRRFSMMSVVLFSVVCSRAEFNFTSQYVVQVDDFFLHYLHKVSYFSHHCCIADY